MNAPAKIEFNCPSCDKAFSVASQLVGKTAKCGACGSKFVVPDLPLTFAVPFPDQSRFNDDVMSVTQAAHDPFGDFDGFSTAAAHAFPDPIVHPDADPFVDLGSLGSGALTVPEENVRRCSECSAPMAVQAVFCVNCGFDMRTGKQRKIESALDTLDFPQPVAFRYVSAAVVVICLVIALDIAWRMLAGGLEPGSVAAMLCCLPVGAIASLGIWGSGERFEVLKSPGNPPLLVKTIQIGPIPLIFKWDLSQFECICFVQKPWSTFWQIFTMMRDVTSVGVYWLLRRLRGNPEQLNYRAELRSSSGRKVALCSGNELVKDKVNQIVRLVRSSGLPLKNDIEMLH